MSDPRSLHDKSLRCYYPNRRLRVLMRAALRHVGPDSAAARVLDVGCGPGVLGEWLRDHGVQYVGVDLDPDYCKFAQARGLDVRQADIMAPPDLGEFDVVVASEVLEHIDNGFELLASLRRCLKPSGLLLLSVPSLSAFRWCKRVVGRTGVAISAEEHVVEFAPDLLTPRDSFWMSYKQLGAHIREAGYTEVWRKGVGALDIPRGLKLADWTFQHIGSTPLDALDWLCDLCRGIIGCRYLCLGLAPSKAQ